jgi:hypothetical protein
MLDERLEDAMIDIGDPAEEPTAPPVAPQVVIHYRERGIPWMLIPPLVALTAALSVVGYQKLAPRPAPPVASTVVSVTKPSPSAATPPPAEELVAPEPVAADPSGPRFLASELSPVPPELVAEEASTASAAVAEVSKVAPAEPEPAAEVVALPGRELVPPANPEPKPVARIEGLGFDPRALQREASVDANVAPAQEIRREGAPSELAGPANVPPAVAPLPEDMDPDLLPPDPKLARLSRLEHGSEIRRQVDAERNIFHAELRAICKKYSKKSGPWISELCTQFHADVDPTTKKKAAKMLNLAGAGGDWSRRVQVLRSLGLPEAVILYDINDFVAKKTIGEVGGPRDMNEALYRSALILLSHPPTRPTARPAASPSPAPASSRPR